MTPITPERFIELMEQDRDSIKLWNHDAGKYWEVTGIYCQDGQWLLSHVDGGKDFPLSDCYESKPETPLEQLDKLIQKNERRNFSFHESLSGSIVQWRNKYESQLKELK